MSRRIVSVNEALALIFDEALEGDPNELSDEDRPSSSELEEGDADFETDGSPCPKQRRIAEESSDSLVFHFSTPVTQTNPQPDQVIYESSAEFEVTVTTERATEPELNISSTPNNSSVEEVSSSSILLDDLPVDHFEEECATLAMQQSTVPVSYGSVIGEETLQEKVRVHNCSSNCLEQFSEEEVLSAVWGIRELSTEEKNMLLLGKLMTCSMKNTTKKGKGRKRMGHYFTFDHHHVCRAAFCILHDISVKKLKNLKAHLQKNGFASIVHGNYDRKSHHAYSFEVIKNVVAFIKNFGEIH